MFTGNCRRRRKQNPTISASPAESVQSAKELKLRGLLSQQPANCLQLPRPCTLASQEMGVELKLKVQAAIKPDPAKGQTSCVKWSEISFFLSCLYMHAHAFKSMQWGCCFLWGHRCSSPSPSVSLLTAPGTSRLQFTGPPSMYWVINYAILPRMRTQSQRQAMRWHSASPLSFHPLLTVPFSNSARSGRYSRYLLYPSLAALSGTMSPHLNMVPPPPTSTLPPPKLIPGSSQGPTPGLLCPCPAEERWALDGEGP